MPKPRTRPRTAGTGTHRSAPAGAASAPTLPRRVTRRTTAALVALMSLYALVYGAIVFTKFRYYLYTDFDLAIFTQATDQALRGSLFSSIRGMNWLGDHVSLILFVIAPVYALLRHPLTLLFLQTVVLALGALPVFALARRELGHDGIALSLAALYLLYPAIGYTNLFEFHPEVLATTTLLATFWALNAGRLRITILFAALSLACREDVALVVMMLGLTALLPGRPRRFAFALLGLAAVSLVLSFAVIRPAFASAAAEYGRMYEQWGATIGEVAINAAKDPLRALGALFSTPGDAADTLLKRNYWLHMLAPLLFLPLLSPVSLAIALPVLAEHFLSSRPQQHWLLFQYTALVTPVMVYAAVRGLGNLVRRVGRAPAPPAIARGGAARLLALGVAGAAVLLSLVCNLGYGPLLRQGWTSLPEVPQSSWPQAYDRTRRVHRDRMVAGVPREGGVVAAFEFLARLASRPNVHSLHHLYTGYFTYSTRPYPVPDGIQGLIADVGDQRLAMYVNPGTSGRLRDLVDRNDLRPVDAAGDLLLFRRAATDTVELFREGSPAPEQAREITWDRQLVFAGATLPETTVISGGLLPIETHWRSVATPDRRFMTQFVIRNAQERVVFSIVRHLGYLLYPATTWREDTPVRETFRLLIPREFEPGDYSLGMRVGWWRDGPLALSRPDDSTLVRSNLVVPLGRFTVTRPSAR